MKKLIIALTLALIAFTSYGQFSPVGLNYNAETTSRTIYYALTGNDTTGLGTSIAPYRSPLRCVQDIRPNIVGCTITISGSGTGNVPITIALSNAIAKISAVNAELAFVGTTITDTLTGFTVSKTGSRLFAYTLSKAGLTATADQYVGFFTTTTAKTAFYPVAYNAAGTNSFEIEYVHNSLTTQTNLIKFGVTWTNPGNLANAFDFGFKSSKFSVISFANMNLNGGSTTVQTFYTAGVEKMFTACRFDAKGINIGDAGPGERVCIRFVQCALIQTTGGAANFITTIQTLIY
jgi:hypothetical protein